MSVTFEEIRLSLPHIEVAAHLYGPEDGQPVIALHGWLDNAATFSRLAPLLEGVRIVALDLPGHGHSDHRPLGAAYNIWDYAHDVLQTAEQFGWKRFSLLGHSMGAIVSVLLAGAMPDRVERLALIDGVIPYTGEAETAPQKLGESLQKLLVVDDKRKPVYASFEQAVAARMKGVGAVSHEAAERLAQRGLMPVPGGYTWRTDARLMLPSSMRLTRAHALAFVHGVACPASLVLAEQGLLTQPAMLELTQALPFVLHRLPGGHHLHLDDQVGAEAVAAVFNPFFAG
ncbi:alpha/beta hydrolase [Pseudomonas sp. Choline-3u-10]|jgi:pimeloyl-ACP methyl ester carboxylesterase|uniref:Alpha/beta hydrolase n=1 Tax=Stutzerimonas stutzeri TaxID=316 RepID=A0A172WVJ8_STUST|nr:MULTISPECIES: alpha/beta fold hydrolase [Pseudomonadaceae]MAL36656.1 alpha/beta hydrolase [Pseudomonas sp.]MBU0948195.1 alpha/beta hydrolase [Gammaproteobacteria bacterium]BAP79220.1 hydrolase [Pseudomonas sp. MT-1]ANF27544.1 alpha/beta hydrolase [Stutzerimonas stutzeri]KJJ61646.1 alpha/beta hydrolase [Pseudomonas sp. 10B238]|tara:strand:+ start:2221 stop:3078 length:858 start_codon:yes stop_codon:yes gene_type:complete